MQLIFNTDRTDIGIQNMSAIPQESLEEKFINKSLIDKIGKDSDDIPNGNCANIKDIVETCNENVKTTVDEQVTSDILAVSESFFNTNQNETSEENGKTLNKDVISEKKENIEAVSKEHVKHVENKKTSELESVTNKDADNSKIKNIEEKKENFEEGQRQTEGLIGKSEEESEKKNEIGNQNKSEVINDKSEQNATKDVDKNEVKEKVITCEEMKELNVDVSKDDKLEIQVSNVSKIDKNKDIDEDKKKEIVKSSEIESRVDMGISDQSAENKVCIESSALTTSNYIDKQIININCDAAVRVGEVNGNLSDKSTDINENNKIIEKQPEEIIEIEKQKEIANNMEIDDVIITGIDKSDYEKETLQSNNDDVNNQTINNKTEFMIENNKREEVIDIPDDKDEEFKDETEEIPVTVRKQDLSNIKRDDPSIQIAENDSNRSNFVINSSSSEGNEKLNSLISDKDIRTITKNHVSSDNNVDQKKPFSQISKLSNTLDILSDDEDAPKDDFNKDIQNTVPFDKQYINLEDDDDIMLIDEETNVSSAENKTESAIDPVTDTQGNADCKEEYKIEELDPKESSRMSKDRKDNSEPEVGIDTNELNQEANVPEESESQLKPLLPVNFLKTCKKNLADMTRDELEEFCILKIVESVVDRGNLSEIKNQLKTMAQYIDEYKKKASMLTKQNRELQVVLKSVQEEQKKKSDSPITPLKITRSVGIQVLMTDKIGVRRKPLQGMSTPQNNLVTNSPSPRSGKNQTNQNSRLKTNSNTSPTIPVPRLVPAVNNSNLNNIKIQTTNTNSPGKSQVANIPNGLSSLPATQKPEKRPHSRMQQNNSVTVDLTDDEPPSKLHQRTATPPVRLVNPQNLLAPHRQPFGTNINSPRKVYIPISGSQNQAVRPGQTIMLKAISPQAERSREYRDKKYIETQAASDLNSFQRAYPKSAAERMRAYRARKKNKIPKDNPRKRKKSDAERAREYRTRKKGKGPRQRCATPAVSKPNQTPNTVRMQRLPSRHPAPLPDSMKQYQPPNWKALPPAPELKLSKVENGIVISWKIDGYQEENHEEIASYQLYAYQETASPPSTALWKKIGDVKALPLPMACTLTQFMAGYKYYFAVRAVDVRSRLGPFSLPGSILLLNKM